MNNEFYPTGIVKIYDGNTSKLISEGHNMILKAGRDYIRNMFLSMILESSSDTINNMKNTDGIGMGLVDLTTNNGVTTVSPSPALPLYGIYLGTDGSATLLTGEYSVDGKILIRLTDNDIEFNADSNSLKLTIKIDSDTQDMQNIVARELGIILGDPLGDHIVFSRISFDPISLEAGASVNLEYYIYF